MLALLLLFQHATAKDISKNTNYVIKRIDSCPDEGYFFKREAVPNSVEPDECQLCFCQDNGTAVCWRRENKRCDVKYYHSLGKRDTRVRRSPLSFGEVFVRDAARDFFNKQSPEQCKPYESSFSDGCPPADWCIGCTVCDCDANGRWDCHVLSFCPDKKGKPKQKKRRGPLRNRVVKRQSKTSTTKAGTQTKTPKPLKKPNKKPVFKSGKRNAIKQMSATNKQKIDPVKSTTLKKITPVKKPTPKSQAKKGTPNKTKATKPVFIKKGVTKKPITIKANKNKLTKNNTVEVAQQVVKQFMTTMQRMMKNIERKSNSTIQANKVVQKRSMPTQNKIAKKVDKQNLVSIIKKVDSKHIRKRFTPTPMPRKPKKGRNKREILVNATDFTTPYSSFFAEELNPDNTDMPITTEHNIIINASTDSLPTLNDLDHVDQDNNTFFITNAATASLSTLNDTYVNEDTEANLNQTMYTADALNNGIETWQVQYTTNQYLINNTYNSNNTQNYDEIQRFNNNSYYDVDKKIETSSMKDETNLSMKYGQLNWLANILQYENDFTKSQQVVTSNNKTSAYSSNKITPMKIIDVNNNQNLQNDRSCSYRKILHRLLTGFDSNNTTKREKKPKKLNFLRKLKRIFKKIFYKNRKVNNKSYHDNLDALSLGKYGISKSDSKSTGHCKLSILDRMRLRKNIDDLRGESKTILKTIRIIKGLLHILDLNDNETKRNEIQHGDANKMNDARGFSETYDNIYKLNAIMKDTYKGLHPNKLSEVQETQITYIKDNIQQFIKSIGKFATILDDVIKLLAYHDKINILSDTVKNTASTTEAAKHNTKDIAKDKFDRLKKLILNYNVLQNKFVQQIYKVLNNIEANITSKHSPINKVSDDKVINKTDAVETNAKMIINNLRKLKVLAEHLNSKIRKKRDTIRDEDAMEYLLILMEYLLRRHAPLNNPPVNDGIDLLIDAIKTAPDIKPIKKKVLDYIPERKLVTRTSKPLKFNSFHDDNIYSESKSIQKEENGTSQLDKNKLRAAQDSQDDDDDEESIEEIYQKFKSDKGSDKKPARVNDLYAYTTTPVTTESQYNDRETTEETDKNKIKDSEYSNKLTNEVIYDDLEENLTLTSTSTVTANLSENESETTPSITTSKSFFNQENESNADKLLVDAKANIEWIEENFKDLKQIIKNGQSTQKPKTVTRTKVPKVKNAENVSDISNEEDRTKKTVKVNAEDIVAKKRMDLLNSMEYGEKQDIEEDTDSKDDTYFS